MAKSHPNAQEPFSARRLNGTFSQMPAADPPTREDHAGAAASSHGSQGAAASFKVYIIEEVSVEDVTVEKVEVTRETTVGNIQTQNGYKGWALSLKHI